MRRNSRIGRPAEWVDWERDEKGWVADKPINVEKVILERWDQFEEITRHEIDNNRNVLDNTVAMCTYDFGWTPSRDSALQALRNLTGD